jgi:hypothetical protein
MGSDERDAELIRWVVLVGVGVLYSALYWRDRQLLRAAHRVEAGATGP